MLRYTYTCIKPPEITNEYARGLILAKRFLRNTSALVTQPKQPELKVSTYAELIKHAVSTCAESTGQY